ncbi:MAG: hypothetical protein M5U28_24020 [Sandaracinaceae bacterium]|nr:hypothetical protein [Sandaracinaceae bacterium]
MRVYAGGYEAYLEAKAEREAHEVRAEQNRQNLVRRELDWLRRSAPRAPPSRRRASIAPTPPSPRRRRAPRAPRCSRWTRCGAARRCSSSIGCASPWAIACWSTISRSRSRPASASASWGRTAPARPRCSAPSSARWRPRRGA